MKTLMEERLFEPFIDATDGVLCLPSGHAVRPRRAAVPRF